MPTPIPQKMKAVALDHFGGPEVIGLKLLPVPECADDEVLIRVHAAGVGVWDPWEREGEMVDVLGIEPRFPYVPGSDAAGEVVATGKRVTRFRVGDQVYGYALGNPKGGAYAEYLALNQKQVAPVPKGLSVEEAGALAIDGITALRGLENLKVRWGQKLLIFGANGGIGHIALQFAKRMGAKVLAIASGRDGVELARSLGADAVAEGHDAAAVDEACRRFSAGGLDAALVLAFDEHCRRALQCVRSGGRIAYPNGVEPQPEGPEGVEVIGYDGTPSEQVLDQLNELIEAGPFHVKIGRQYALEEAVRAQQDVLRHHLGKLELKIH